MLNCSGRMAPFSRFHNRQTDDKVVKYPPLKGSFMTRNDHARSRPPILAVWAPVFHATSECSPAGRLSRDRKRMSLLSGPGWSCYNTIYSTTVRLGKECTGASVIQPRTMFLNHLRTYRIVGISFVVGMLVFGATLGLHSLVRAQSGTELAAKLRAEIERVVIRDMHAALQTHFLSINSHTATGRFLHTQAPITEGESSAVYTELRRVTQESPYISEVRVYNGNTLRGYSSYRSRPLSLETIGESSVSTTSTGEVEPARLLGSGVEGQEWSWLDRTTKQNLGFREQNLVFAHILPMYRTSNDRALGVVMIAIQPWRLFYETNALESMTPENTFVTTPGNGDMLRMKRPSVGMSAPLPYTDENAVSRADLRGITRSATTSTRRLNAIVRLPVPLVPATAAGSLALFIMAFLGFHIDTESRTYTYLLRVLTRHKEKNPPKSISIEANAAIQKILDTIKAAIREDNEQAVSENLDRLADAFREYSVSSSDQALFQETLVQILTQETSLGSQWTTTEIVRIQETCRTVDTMENFKHWFLGLYESRFETPSNSHDAQDEDLARRIKAYIASSDKAALSLETVAEAFNMSSRHLSRVFKSTEGENFSKYLVRARFEAACNLLCENLDLSIADISNEVGYSNVGYFIKLFKQHTGVTPGQYRRRCVLGDVPQEQTSNEQVTST